MAAQVFNLTTSRRGTRLQGDRAPVRVSFDEAPQYYEGGQFEGELYPRQPARQRTQEDQDKADEAARKEAMKDLVQSWMDRLQLISLITTFFASVESQLVGNTVPSSGPWSPTLQAANSGLMGALVMHSFAAILSFFGAFILVRYKVKEANKEEIKAEGGQPTTTTTTTSPVDVEKTAQSQSQSQTPRPHASPADIPTIFSSDPRLVQVGPFSRQPPIMLLQRVHTLCLWTSAVGFVLALMGILCFSWSMMPRSVSIFASACLGVCVVGSVFTVA
ncbi:hypothetical protein NEOLEDRAFT_1099703 [Neolentinus lepideus HHB14362 ss-1]|uniref:Transmembrane protein n=1 Tax=Neolentinus lepideus HHB14362 ss-1 TaxID=1314782 RepID=A0A165PHC1_9AGAM|nr:hypothetical protein NEOLEDRAFT_1099703 [Neolentinus lepideus HHB14362 ss-1]